MIPGSGAISAIVPYALNGQVSALAHVESAGQSSNTVLVPLAPAALGAHLTGPVNGTGTGQALAFNQDGTPNSQASPAPVGSVVTFYATGAGQTAPPGVDEVLHRTAPAVPFFPSLFISLIIPFRPLNSASGRCRGFPPMCLKCR